MKCLLKFVNQQCVVIDPSGHHLRNIRAMRKRWAFYVDSFAISSTFHPLFNGVICITINIPILTGIYIHT